MKTCFKEACFCDIFDRANAPIMLYLVPGFNTVTRAEFGRLNNFVVSIALSCLINFEKNPLFLCHLFFCFGNKVHFVCCPSYFSITRTWLWVHAYRPYLINSVELGKH